MALNETLVKFGYPASLIADYENWYVLLRPEQVTLGALILIEKNGYENFSDISPESFAELAHATSDIERALRDHFCCEKINYLMLMMVDPEVHFHVIPRYADEKTFDGVKFADPGWPAIPNLGSSNALEANQFEGLRAALARNFKSK